MLVGDIDVDGVVPVRAADAVHKLEAQYLGMLAQPPGIRLASGQPGAVDAALLACAHADGHPVLHIAHRVGLGVLQGDEGEQHVVLGGLGQLLIGGDDVFQHGLADGQIVVALLKDNAEDAPALHRGGGVAGVDLHHVVAALALGLQNLQRLLGVVRGDDAVGHL